MKNKSGKTIIFIIGLLIVILLILLIVLNSITKKQMQNDELKKQVNSYTSITDFKTMEEVAAFLECKYLKKEISKEENYQIDVYMKIKIKPYTDTQSNEGFYNKLIAYSANALKYQNFRIIDNENNITVQVICDSENKKIKSTLINGEANYFKKHDSYLEISKMTQIEETKFSIQSNILKKIINNNWKINNSEIGTKESSFNSYDIYFDEGIEVRKVDNKVFNIVFNEKYKDKIANNITTSMTKDEIIKVLGEPTFSDESFDFIGYMGENIYLFYNSQKEISIYRVEKDYDSSEFSKIVDSYLESKDETKLIQKVKDKYTDFDKFESDSNGVILQYTLKGIVIRFQKGLSKGIQIYNNYKGIIYDNIKLDNISSDVILPDNIFINNNNLVAKNELDRIQSRDNMIFRTYEEREKFPERSQSDKYGTIKTEMSDGSYKIQFIALDNSNVNSELRENINYYVWIDNDNFIYSITNRGIYLYNVSLRKYATIITGNDEVFKIIEYKNNTLKYDEKSITIKK